MWVLFAFASALFAGLTAVLAKVGVRDVDANLATALRTVVVLAFSWLMVAVEGVWRPLGSISAQALLFLALSGLATGASWLAYFHALQLGEVSRVAAVDKCSTVLTMLLAFLLLGEALTLFKATGHFAHRRGHSADAATKNARRASCGRHGAVVLVRARLGGVRGADHHIGQDRH